jgi:transcriptional regulator with XRE-family HTH domain
MTIAKSRTAKIAPGSTAGIGLRIQQVRKELGLSQAALADAIARSSNRRTSKAQISQWETSRVADPKDVTLQAIAVALGVSPRWLATGQGSRAEVTAAADIKRAVRIACDAIEGEEIEPEALAVAIWEVAEMIAEAPASSDNVLSRIARLAYRSLPGSR